MYLAAVVWNISMPSFNSSPWILGAPHSGLAWLKRLISALIRGSSAGLPWLLHFRAQ
jgi:hypothetical protein